MKMPSRAALYMGGAIGLAAASGFLASSALSSGEQVATKTTTVNVGSGTNGVPGPQGPKGDTGPRGPAGPKGDKGDPGSSTCPAGFSHGELVINHPGGQVTLFTCLKD